MYSEYQYMDRLYTAGFSVIETTLDVVFTPKMTSLLQLAHTSVTLLNF